MKILNVLLFLSCSLCGFGQYFSSDLVNEEVAVTWLGLDFSEARIIVDEKHTLDEGKLTSLIKIWNDKVVTQSSKFPLKKAFHRKKVSINTDRVNAINASINSDGMIVHELHLLYNNNIKMAFSRYRFQGMTEGIGVVFLVEAIDYAHQEFSGYMIPIDLADGRIIKTYYLKTRFNYELEEEDLIQPFRQILLQYADKLDRQP